jgi:spermidine synthase
MSTVRIRSLPRYLGLSFTSGSVLALQVVFTRIFSIMIWHHFTYLVIGVALLGGGAAGTYLAIRQWDAATISRRIGRLAIGFSISVLISLLVITQVQFNPLESEETIRVLIGLATYFAAMFAMFFLGGLTVVSAFRLWLEESHRLYFADLMGAGISTLAVVWLMHVLGGPSVIVLIALLALTASFLFGVRLPRRWKPIVFLMGLGQLGLLLYTLLNPIQLPAPESKFLSWALQVAEASKPEYTRWNPVARVDVVPPIKVSEPTVLGGISSAYSVSSEYQEQEEFEIRFMTLDGTSQTAMYQFDGNLSRFEALRHTIISAPYQVSVDQPKTLNIGVGGGLDILLARLYDARQITAIDLNSDVVASLSGRYADFTGRLADDPRTTLITAEGRSFLMRDNTQYDIIQGIGLDNLAALSSGAYVLSESYLYTVEALDLALRHLTPQGIFAWTRRTSNPPSEMLRLTGMAAEALRQQGVSDPARHIVIVSNEPNDTVTLLVSSTPFMAPTMEKLREWTELNQFNVLHDPFERLDTVYAEYLYAPDPRAFEKAYLYDIHPVTDDHPFYYNYFKWSNVLKYFNADTQGSGFKRFPVGNLILLTTLGFAAITAVIFIVFPLLRYERSGLRTPYAKSMLTYFSALGLSYIFVEIVLIQRFTLFIGYPTHAIATTIFGMLFFSAIGSLVSEKVCKTPITLRIVLLIVTGMILLYVVGLPPLFQSLLRLPASTRIILSIVFIAPLAFFMGMPFPTGLGRLGAQAPNLIPWAWGVNGVFSVLGSVLVILISMLTNFTSALVSAALLYSVAAAVSASLWKTAVVVDTARLENEQSMAHSASAEAKQVA